MRANENDAAKVADLGKQLETIGRSLQTRRVTAAAPRLGSVFVRQAPNETEVNALVDKALAKGVAQQVK